MKNTKYFILILIFIFLTYFLLFFYFQNQISYEETQINSSYVKMYLPAVDENNKGVLTELIVEIQPGSGKILTNIDKIKFWVDTQDSIQTAKKIAEEITRINTNNIDIIYTIKTDNATLVGGSSAGAAITIATIAALKNKSINQSIIITGTIEKDGSIGEVGGILEKIKAAKSKGVSIFLIPEENFKQDIYTPVEKCINQNGYEICEKRYEKKNIKDIVIEGIQVIAVNNIYDALKYFNL
ncbi:MAG: S16 family serine protease [Candidatus Aenigmatarchaeota archaeon]|nr:hypothetical protein [Candidatus Aenigmarchaeota archaeon]